LRANTLASVGAHAGTGVPILEPEPGDDPFSAAAPADVVMVQPGVVVAAGWLDALRRAARAQSTTATASALTLGDLDQDPIDRDLVAAAAAVASGSLRLLPRLAAARGPCVYVCRSALDLAGGFDDGFSARCIDRGLSHVLADDVLVGYQGADRGDPPLRSRHGASGPLVHALGAVRRALNGLSVVIDARILYGPTTGTQVHVLEVIAGLARTGRLRLTVILPDDPSEYAITRLRSIPGLALVSYDEASREASRPGAEPADVVHRPFQVSNAGDLSFLRSIGERVILTQQDLIGFHNPAYFVDAQAWQDHRWLTRLALAAVDRVAFFSAHTRDDALAEELVEPVHACVVPLGVDHVLDEPGRAQSPPSGADRLSSGSAALLCLGTDYLHKNRVFALRMLELMKARHRWDGVLVFAGPAVRHGSSRAEEARLLAGVAGLADSVIDVGAVSEAEKAWLLERAALVVYPSVLEGFGLVPFEAAEHGVPCMWAPGSALSETLPDGAAELVPWDAEQSAERALTLLRDQAAREHNLATIRAAGARLRWETTAARLVELYHAAAKAPPAPAGRLPLEAGPAAGGSISEDAMRLIGPGGELPSDVERPLLALATHRRLAGPAFATLKLGYRASYLARRWRGRRSQT